MFFVLALVVAVFTPRVDALIWVVFTACVMAETGRISFKWPPIERLAKFFVINSAVSRVGAWSYSTYLIHLPILSLVVGGFALFHGSLSQNAAGILTLASLPVIFIASWASYVLIEKPFNRIGWRIAEIMKKRLKRMRHCKTAYDIGEKQVGLQSGS